MGERLFCPAKINLFLAVTGRRTDGYHEIVSLVAPLAFGDFLEVGEAEGASDELFCEDPRVPADRSNLIFLAAEAFRAATGTRGRFRFRLEKKIPPGGGLGGGSGNAVRALEAMNRLRGEPCSREDLARLAAGIGSDCPLFLEPGPSVIRGRGEVVEPAPEWADLLADWKVGLFDPGFASPTGALYEEIARSGAYRDPDRAARELADGREAFRAGNPAPLLRNDLGRFLARKFLFYDTLESLFRRDGLEGFGVTGSGSVSFLLFRGEEAATRLRRRVRDVFGTEGFMIETGFARPDDRRSA